MSPAPLGVHLLGAWLALAVASAFAPALLSVWIGAGAALAFAALLDALSLWRTAAPAVEREVPQALAVGVWSEIALRVENAARGRRLRILVHDHHPGSFEVEGLPRPFALAAGEHVRFKYRVYPTERGEQRFAGTDVLATGLLGLLRRRYHAGSGSSLRVYPNFRAVMKYTLLATDNHTSQLGIRKRPRRGEGLDFLQLREYREGDMLRQIDWQATSRLQKSISREYQDERDQQIVFLLDCGRKMHARDEALSHFDHALNAVLLLAHVALRQGDAVGLMTFSGERRWLAPRKGSAHLNSLMNTVYDLQTSVRASDYLAAANELARRVRKRALVVVVSNLRDEEQDELAQALQVLRRSHLVLLASMQEQILNRVLEAPVNDLDSALRVGATRRYLQQRQRAHQQVSRAGILALDVEPRQLPVALVNGYLDIKSRGTL